MLHRWLCIIYVNTLQRIHAYFILRDILYYAKRADEFKARILIMRLNDTDDEDRVKQQVQLRKILNAAHDLALKLDSMRKFKESI